MQRKSETTGAKPIGAAEPLDDSGAFISRKKYAAALGFAPGPQRAAKSKIRISRLFFILTEGPLSPMVASPPIAAL